MFGKLSMGIGHVNASIQGLRAYLERVEYEGEAAQTSDCYYPGCMCGIQRLALTPEITLNCNIHHYGWEEGGASCDNLPGCQPEFSSDPWNINEFLPGNSVDIAGWPGGIDAADVESMSWYTNGMGFTLQGIPNGLFLAFTVGEEYSLEHGVTYAGTPSPGDDICAGAWDHEWVDDGNKIVTITHNPYTIRVYDAGTANDPMAGSINTTPLSTLVVNTEWAEIDDTLPGPKFWMAPNGLSMWIWVAKSGGGTNLLVRRLLYIKLLHAFDVSSAIYTRISQELFAPAGASLSNTTILSLDFNYSNSYATVVVKSNATWSGSIWRYDICSMQDNLITCFPEPEQFTGAGALLSFNDDLVAADINPNGSSLALLGAGSQGDKMYKGSFGEIATDCDIWNIYINADIAPVRDTGLSPVFYGWTKDGNVTHKFYVPDIYNLCPTATPSNAHYGKSAGVTPYFYETTGVGVTAGEIDYKSPCFHKGYPRSPVFSHNINQSYLIEGVTGSFIDLPRFSVTAQDADGHTYLWRDFNPGSTAPNENKVWMVENLKTHHLFDLDGHGHNHMLEIPGNEQGDLFLQEGNKLDHPPYIVAPNFGGDDDENHTTANEYGYLYNWTAAHHEGICPLGWHLPTEEDWEWLEKNHAEMSDEDYSQSADPSIRGAGTDSGFKTMQEGRYHWNLDTGYRDDPITGKTWPFNSYGAGFYYALSQGSFAEQNYGFREHSAMWTYDSNTAASWIRRWDDSESGLGKSNLGLFDLMASIRCKLNDDVPVLSDPDGSPQWEEPRGPGHTHLVPRYINFRGDYQVATKQEYCKSVGCTTVAGYTGVAEPINIDSTLMYQFNNGRWALYPCTPSTGGHCGDPRKSLYIECGGCDGLLSSNEDAHNTCPGPVVE